MKTRQKIAICAAIAAFTVGPTAANTLWVTNNANAGAGTLRAVVAEAASGDRLAFDYAQGATNITLSTTLQIKANVTLDGGVGVTIRGNHLEVMAGCEVAFENLIFTRSTDCGYGGAVYAHGNTSFDHCRFENNRVSGFGAAIYNDNATCRIRRCAFIGNTASGYGGAVYNWKESAVCDIAHCTFRNNRSNTAFGGAVYADKGLKIRNCAFVGNSADSYGGRVSTSYKKAVAALTGTVNRSSFRGFSAGEVLFLGASGSKRSKKSSAPWEITFRFAVSANQSSVKVGDLTVSNKKGWDYLWVRYADKVADNKKNMIKKPIAAYVEQVYPEGDFGNLGIGN